MSNTIEVTVPDIGDFDAVPVIEILVSVGDEVAVEQSLVTLESDKATMEVPSPSAGTVAEVKVTLGDEVSEGAVIVVLDAAAVTESADRGAETAVESAASGAVQEEASTGPEKGVVAESAADSSVEADDYDFDVVVLGAGPGGYTAAFRAADLGLKVALVERYSTLGGVCLNVGCIPSKALLHAAKVIDEAEAMAQHGVVFGTPEIQLDPLRQWKNGVVGQLTQGLSGMAKKRGVSVLHGRGEFTGAHEITVTNPSETLTASFSKAIIAAGSQVFELPGMPWGDPRLMDSTDALALQDIPERLLVVGGGIIGLEMACVFSGLGSQVTVVELTEQLMPGADLDLVRPLQKRIQQRYAGIHLNTKVTEVLVGEDSLKARFEGPRAPAAMEFDKVLVAVGRVPNGAKIGAANAGVKVTERGFIPVDEQMRTNVPHIFAIGDIVGQPMLAHKATHEAKVAAEVCAGMKSAFDARVIPSVAYTDPEVAWVGLTENEAKQQGLDYGVGKFPWAASGRALGIGRSEGFTKLLFDKSNERIIGAGIVGPNAGELIGECALAIEMGCEAADIGLTVHPHPTLTETVALAAEVFEGTVTDLYIPRRK